MKINWLKKISNKNHHDAFTDLNCSNNVLWLCFRRASDHHSNDGIIVLQSLTNTGKLLNEVEFRLLNSDLRDPKVHILQDKSILLIAYARHFELRDDGTTKLHSQNTFWHSVDGKHWQHKGDFCHPFHWCWQLTWHNDLIYTLAYERKTENLYLYHGADLPALKALPKPVLSKTEHGLGYPNESDLCFINAPNNTQAIAIVRRDADTFTTQLGKSKPPFIDWKWQDLSIYLASPCIKKLDNRTLLVAARYEHGSQTQLNEAQISMINYFGSENERGKYAEGELKTGLFVLNIHTAKLKLLMPLPSAEDNGYPGLAIMGADLWVSYYSTVNSALNATPDPGLDESMDPQSTQVYICHIDIAELPQ